MGTVTLANWNGAEMPLAAVRVPALDRGFLFGDAVYEVIRVYRGRPWLFAEHWQRLERCLRDVEIACDLPALQAKTFKTLEHSGVGEGFIYVQVTRGTGPRKHSFLGSEFTANELIYIQALTDQQIEKHQAAGVPVLTTTDQRWRRCDLKTTNLLANCLANTKAQRGGCFEALFVDDAGAVHEGSHTNFFAVIAGTLRTAPLSAKILPGVTRAKVLELAAAAGMKIEERAPHISELAQVDEAFLSGTVTEIMPIRQLDDYSLNISGPVTSRLLRMYRDLIAT